MLHVEAEASHLLKSLEMEENCLAEAANSSLQQFDSFNNMSKMAKLCTGGGQIKA